MALNHGINTAKSETNFATVTTGETGIPFYVGCWPCHRGGGYTGKPQIAFSFDEAKQLGGYSEEWRDTSGSPKWGLCQAMYAHFKVFGCAPAIFFNVFDPATHKSAVSSAPVAVEQHIAKLPVDAIIDSGLAVLNDETALTAGTDYEAYYTEDNLVIELLSASDAYSAESLNISYNAVSFSNISATNIESALAQVENCQGILGYTPDLICCPGYSQTPAVAAVMATAAANINGLFKAKAVVDLDSSASGADEYADIAAYKTANGYTDDDMIVCWPLVKIEDYLFDYSVILCGKIASIDAENGNVPFASPSNEPLPITACVNKAGKEITLTVGQADAISFSAGVVTALSYNGWVCWGNYTGCHPASEDVAKVFICTARMMDFICNTFVRTYWSYLDKPLTRVLIDAIVNSFNAYLNGLEHEGKICGGEIVYNEANNQTDELLRGMFRLDVAMASPVPAQRIDMVVEYDPELLISSLNVNA